MARHFVLSGAGNYLSTPRVNLLDSNTAHLYASIDRWVDNGNSAHSQVDDSDFYSGKAAEETPSNANTITKINIGDAIPVSAATQYTLALSVKRTVDNGDETHYRLRVTDYDSSDVAGTTTDGSHIAIVDDELVTVPVTFTTAGDAAKIRVFLYSTNGTSTQATSSTFRFGNGSLRAGTSSVFLPSLDVIGPIEVSARCAADDWTAAADQYVAGNYDFSSGGFYIRINTAGQLQFNGDFTGQVSTNYVLTDGAFTTIKLTLDTGTGGIVYYQDNVQVDTDSIASGDLSISDESFYVGTYVNGSTGPFTGKIEWVEWRDGIGGPVIARCSASDAVQSFGSSLSDSDSWVGLVDGRTWTASSTGSIAVGSSTNRFAVLGVR